LGQAFIEGEDPFIALLGLDPSAFPLFDFAIFQPVIGIGLLLFESEAKAHLCHLVAAQPGEGYALAGPGGGVASIDLQSLVKEISCLPIAAVFQSGVALLQP